MLSLSGKTRDEVSQAVAGLDREQLITLLHSLVTLERLYTARQVAEAHGCNKRDVLADMKAGRFVDPIYGAGFFVMARNSFRVTGAGVRAWLRARFVQSRRADPIPAQKNTRDLAGDQPALRLPALSVEAMRALQSVGSLAESQTPLSVATLAKSDASRKARESATDQAGQQVASSRGGTQIDVKARNLEQRRPAAATAATAEQAHS